MYEKVIKQNEGKEHFIFHDGPPYANGNMHVGHMLNKVIKDVICRYKNMEGFYTTIYSRLGYSWFTYRKCDSEAGCR